MKKITVLFVAGLVCGYAQSAKEIAQKSYEAISGYGSSVSMVDMVLVNARGVKTKRELKLVRKEGAKGDKSYIEFLYPNDIKGVKLLSYEVIGSDDKQWLYLPALKRIKRISSRNKSGSFVSSEFSYEDISSVNYQNYKYEKDFKIVSKAGAKYFKIVRKPIDKHSGYSKQIVWVSTKDYLARFGEYYDRHNKLLKTISFPKYKKIDGIWRVFKIDIKNVQNHKSSKLIVKKENIKQHIKDRDISKRVLR